MSLDHSSVEQVEDEPLKNASPSHQDILDATIPIPAVLTNVHQSIDSAKIENSTEKRGVSREMIALGSTDIINVHTSNQLITHIGEEDLEDNSTVFNPNHLSSYKK